MPASHRRVAPVMPDAAGLFHRAMTMSGQQVTAAGPRAAAQVGGRNHTPIGTAGGGAQQQALGRGEFGQSFHDFLPHLAWPSKVASSSSSA